MYYKVTIIGAQTLWLPGARATSTINASWSKYKKT